MKTFLIAAFSLMLTAFSANAQRYAIIDTKYILDKIPEYKDANKKLEEMADAWQKEIDLLQADLDKMYRQLETEKAMLTPELLKKREDEIFNKEKQVRDLQRRRFGFEGDYFRKKQELVKPIQDKVYNAVQRLATERLYDFILDKSEGITVIFADPKLDKSDDVLKILGVKL
ncbi:OmpH family outer membrane protein [Lacibacter sp.]|jgi:outer membrane protein|uniref:OmpH family outer membrane protein n=1 Tax=Lacibacter sp. TaxID=1915409 RepID=UPI002B4B8533|nr:OmpH family outer membrane protein [Lacibacter sp.]HLO38724.1 OmpH family outer membrane protein [Lacibacter sp.]HLP36202.1 OmpH family outer membrane protein [Lacibacter sp.]